MFMVAFALAMIGVVVVGGRAHQIRIDERGRANITRSVALGMAFAFAALAVVNPGEEIVFWISSNWRDLNGQRFYDSDYSWYPRLLMMIMSVLSLLCVEYVMVRWDWRYGLALAPILLGGILVHPMYTVALVYNVPFLHPIAAFAAPPILPTLAIALACRFGRLCERSTKCLQCGYDLTGLEGPVPCPECGTDFEEATFVSGTSWRMDLPTLVRGGIGWVGTVAALWYCPLLARTLVEMSYGARAFSAPDAVQLALQYELNSNTTSQLIWPCVLVAVALPTAVQFRIVRWWMVAMVLAVTATTLWWGLKR